MHKVVKKLWLPSSAAVHVAAVGGGGSGALFTSSPAPDTNDGGNANNSFRVVVPITGSTGTQIRATIRPGVASNSLTILHASIGKLQTAGTPKLWETTATPIELKFATASGFSGATTDQVSDWANLSGLSFTTGDHAVVIYDIPTGSTTASQRYASVTGVNTYFKDGIETWDVVAPATMNTASNTNYCVVSVETQ